MSFSKYNAKIAEYITLIKLAIRLQLGHKFWIFIVSVLAWPLLMLLFLLTWPKNKGINETDVQNLMIGFPIYCLAIGIGIRIIASEIERRTLEVNYTIPGGTKRVWIAKLLSASLLILSSELLLALVTHLFFIPISISDFYGAFLGSIFYLVLAMYAGALFKSELMAALASLIILSLNLYLPNTLWLPLFNPVALESIEFNDTLIMLFQNFVIVVTLITLVVLVSFARAERREFMLYD